ncbi:MAG TPA: Flp pilus assembly protein CpaB [Acidimicrobiales bacterium]|nr:Flp pilus assembly protein CpaB [Acidimicrobiales bacterium]
MTARRTVVVVAAVIVGLAAAGLSYYFLNNAQNRAFNNAKLEPAYVVTKAIPRGLTGNDAVNGGYFTAKKIPVEIRPVTAITDLAVIAGKTAIANFPVGQVLVDGMFLSPSQQAVTFSQLIPAGQVAVSVSVDQVHGVANLPQPGDKVDILVNIGGAENFLLQNVLILAIGQTTTGQSGTVTTTPTSAGLFTFAATPANAERIALAEQESLGIYLLLVPPGNPVASVPGVNSGNVLNGSPT